MRLGGSITCSFLPKLRLNHALDLKGFVIVMTPRGMLSFLLFTFVNTKMEVRKGALPSKFLKHANLNKNQLLKLYFCTSSFKFFLKFLSFFFCYTLFNSFRCTFYHFFSFF